MDVKVSALLSQLTETLELEPGELQPDSKSSDFSNWDSMSILNIMIMLESAYGVKIPLADISKLVSVEGILEILRSAGKM